MLKTSKKEYAADIILQRTPTKPLVSLLETNDRGHLERCYYVVDKRLKTETNTTDCALFFDETEDNGHPVSTPRG
jgi:hypothetical protein